MEEDEISERQQDELLRPVEPPKKKENEHFFGILQKTLQEILRLDYKHQIPFWVPFIWFFYDYLRILVQILFIPFLICLYFSPRLITKFINSGRRFKKIEFTGIFHDSYFSWKGIQIRGSNVYYKDRKMRVNIDEMKCLVPWCSMFIVFIQFLNRFDEKKVAKPLYIKNSYANGVEMEYFLKRSKQIPPLPIFLQLFDMENMFSGSGIVESLSVTLNRDAMEKTPIFLKANHILAENRQRDQICGFCDSEFNLKRNEVPHVLCTGKECEYESASDKVTFAFAKGEVTWKVIEGQFRRKPLEVKNLIMRKVKGNIFSQRRDPDRIPRENDIQNWSFHGVETTEVDLLLKPFWKRPEAQIHMKLDSCVTAASFIVQRLPNAVLYHSKTTGTLDGKPFKIEERVYLFTPTEDPGDVGNSPRILTEGSDSELDFTSDSEDSLPVKRNARIFTIPPLPSSFWSDKLALPIFSMFPTAHFGFRVVSTEEGRQVRWRVKGTIVRDTGTKHIELRKVLIEKKLLENALIFGAEDSELVSVLADATRNLIYDGVKIPLEKAKSIVDQGIATLTQKITPFLPTAFKIFNFPLESEAEQAPHANDEEVEEPHAQGIGPTEECTPPPETVSKS